MSDIVLSNPEDMVFARLATLKGGLKLEMIGMRRSKGRSCYAILKSEGYRGSRQKVYEQVCKKIEDLIEERKKSVEEGA